MGDGVAVVEIRDDDGDGTEDVTPPLLTRATVNGGTLVLAYDEALDGASVPAPGAFAVTAAGSTVSANGVSVAGSAVTLTLTLANAVQANQTVTLDYTPGANPIVVYTRQTGASESHAVMRMPRPRADAPRDGRPAIREIARRARPDGLPDHGSRLLGRRPAPGPSPHRQAGVTETRRVGGSGAPGIPPHREATARSAKPPVCSPAGVSPAGGHGAGRPARPPGGPSRRGLQVARDRAEFRGGPGAVVRDHPRGFPRPGEHHGGGGRAARGEFRGQPPRPGSRGGRTPRRRSRLPGHRAARARTVSAHWVRRLPDRSAARAAGRCPAGLTRHIIRPEEGGWGGWPIEGPSS